MVDKKNTLHQAGKSCWDLANVRVEVMMTDPDVAKFLPSQVLCMSVQLAEGKKGEDENLQSNRPTAADQLSRDEKKSVGFWWKTLLPPRVVSR